MNSVNIIGRLTKDPEVKYTDNQLAVCRFSVAINRGKDKDGNDRGADFPNCIAFGKTAETMVISEDEVTDETLLAELEDATAKALAYVLYTLAAGFTYSSHHYERYTTGDVTIE